MPLMKNWLYNTLTDIWLRLEHAIGLRVLVPILILDNEELLEAHQHNRRNTPFLWSIQCPYPESPEWFEPRLRIPKWSRDYPLW